jgi:hypothetical protein
MNTTACPSSGTCCLLLRISNKKSPFLGNDHRDMVPLRHTSQWNLTFTCSQEYCIVTPKYDASTLSLFRCYSCSSVSEEHFMGPCTSVCRFPRNQATHMTRITGEEQSKPSLLEHTAVANIGLYWYNNDLKTLLANNGNQGHCLETMSSNTDLGS